jgi:hypothetical protein
MFKKTLLLVEFLFIALILVACGGGGGSTSSTDTSSTVTTATLSGTAAAGAPLDGATITVKDATGAIVGTTTAGTDGSFKLSFDPKGFTAPFVISASGTLGAGAETFISVSPNAPTAGTTQTVNVTPVTNAIASRISSSGNPLDLFDNITSQKGNISSTNVSSTESAFRTFLADHLGSVGLNSSFNLINDVYSSSFDKLLDNVKFDVSPSGLITVISSAGQAINDLAASNTTPSAGTVAVIAAGNNPTSADKANIPAPSSNSNVIGIDVLETIRTSLNTCMQLPTASRATSTECSKYIISDYKNDGKTLLQEFGTGGSIDFTSSDNDGMVFKKPEILRQIDMTKDAEIVQVRLTGLRKDGTTREVVSIAKNNVSGAGTGWKLTGNGRDYYTFINSAVTKRISQGVSTSRYESDLNIYFGSNSSVSSSVSYVKVSGPGLPSGGLYLRPKTGCDFLTITPPKSGVTTVNSASDLADPDTPSTNTAYPSQTIPCSSLYRLQVVKISDGTPVSFSSNQWLQSSPQKTNDEVIAINTNALYAFEIHNKTNNTTLTYWNRLRGRPLLASEIRNQVKFVDFTDATKAEMTSGASFYSGGNAPTVAWTTPQNTALPFKVTFFHYAGSDEINIPYGSASAVVPCSGNTECNGTNYKASLDQSSQYIFQLLSRNRFDLQILTQITK